MLLQPPKLTSRKFYNKWLYKVTIRIQTGSLMRYNDMDSVANLCLNGDKDDKAWGWNAKVYQEREDLYKISYFLSTKDKTLWSKRIERNYIDLYTNDKTLFEEFSNIVPERVKHRFAPDADSIELLEDSPTIVAVKKLPHDRYRHKVYLLPHKMKGDAEGKEKYIDWLKKQEPKVTCTPAVRAWFLTTDWNWDRRYILVEDEAMLLMLKLRNAEVVGRVYNYVLYDK